MPPRDTKKTRRSAVKGNDMTEYEACKEAAEIAHGKTAILRRVMEAKDPLHPNTRYLPSTPAWRPIETAPKDQRIRLWAWGKERHGRWNDDRFGRAKRPYWAMEEMPITACRQHPPTHWMPCADGPDMNQKRSD